MLAVELECIFGTVVHSFFVGKEVGVDHHLSNDGTVLHYLTLNTVLVLCYAVVNHLVESVISSAFIGFQMVFCALLSFACVGVALFWDESSPLAPIECAVHVSTIAPETVLIAVDQFLS